MTDDFFVVFADWATKKGLNAATQVFAGRLSADVLAEYVDEYERRARLIQFDDPPVIGNPQDGWYIGPNDDDRFWPPLKGLFRHHLRWDDAQVDKVDRSSNKVVSYTPHPGKQAWTSQGLVVGYVQSGKTTNFTAVIAKAADVGYKLVIVLSGIHNGLRRQTQERLDAQLRDLSPRSWLTLTDASADFTPSATPAQAFLHKLDSQVALCVVKKNKAVLTKLDAWLKDASDAHVLDDVPVLVIDDEADQAGVATKTINPLIRGILAKLPRSTYIGYTATPFANILIAPGSDDLYPNDFILNLPRPDGYFGSERIFGRDVVEGEEASGEDLDGFDMVRQIDDDELEFLRPLGNNAAASFEPAVTPSLRSALLWFWLATAARRARGDRGHSTMLVHTSMKIAVHQAFRPLLVELRDEVLKDLGRNDDETLEELRELWDEETGRVPATHFADLHPTTFEEARRHLDDVIASTRIILDNCASLDRLDYSGESQVAIAIGGNTLSRGLTLEGLCVSFFVRSAGTYDTLLQMARWFGFRRGYEDLPRVWMTEQLATWFRHLATVEHEIRLDIQRYEEQNLNPREFGVRIRTHPALRVTAKMGAARPAFTSYGGRRVQTRYFRAQDREWLETNRSAADDLLTAVRADAGRPERLDSGATLFRDVDAETVVNFLRAYRSHTDSPDLDPDLLVKYIQRERRAGSLDRWSVAIMSAPASSHGHVRLGGMDFYRITRAQLNTSSPDRADIKTLMSKDHRVVDLQISSTDARALNESRLMDMRNEDEVSSSRGLLLLYPIDPVSQPEPSNERTRTSLNALTDVIGMALVFPGNAELNVESSYVAVDLSTAEVEGPDPAELAELTDSAT